MAVTCSGCALRDVTGDSLPEGWTAYQLVPPGARVDVDAESGEAAVVEDLSVLLVCSDCGPVLADALTDVGVALDRAGALGRAAFGLAALGMPRLGHLPGARRRFLRAALEGAWRGLLPMVVTP